MSGNIIQDTYERITEGEGFVNLDMWILNIAIFTVFNVLLDSYKGYMERKAFKIAKDI